MIGRPYGTTRLGSLRRRAALVVEDVAGLSQVAVHADRGAERDQVRREREVLAAVEADAADRADEVRREVTAQDALDRRAGRAHVRVLVDGLPEEQVALVAVEARLEDVVTSSVLQLADRADAGAVHHPPDARQEPRGAVERVVEVDQVVGGERAGRRGAGDARAGGGDDAVRLDRAGAGRKSSVDVVADAVTDLVRDEPEQVHAGILDHLAADLNQEAVLEGAEVDEAVERRIARREHGALGGDRRRGRVRRQRRDLDRLAHARVEHANDGRIEHRAGVASLEDDLVVQRGRHGSAGAGLRDGATLERVRADLATRERADGLGVRVGVAARLIVGAMLASDRVEARGALLVDLELLDDRGALIELGADAIVGLLLLGGQVAVLRGRRVEEVLRLGPCGLAKVVLALDVVLHSDTPFMGSRLVDIPAAAPLNRTPSRLREGTPRG